MLDNMACDIPVRIERVVVRKEESPGYWSIGTKWNSHSQPKSAQTLKKRFDFQYLSKYFV